MVEFKTELTSCGGLLKERMPSDSASAKETKLHGLPHASLSSIITHVALMVSLCQVASSVICPLGFIRELL